MTMRKTLGLAAIAATLVGTSAPPTAQAYLANPQMTLGEMAGRMVKKTSRAYPA